jgi:hypothetical protein
LLKVLKRAVSGVATGTDPIQERPVHVALLGRLTSQRDGEDESVVLVLQRPSVLSRECARDRQAETRAFAAVQGHKAFECALFLAWRKARAVVPDDHPDRVIVSVRVYLDALTSMSSRVVENVAQYFRDVGPVEQQRVGHTPVDLQVDLVR